MISEFVSKLYKFSSINGIRRTVDYLLYQTYFKNLIKGVVINTFHKLYHYSYQTWDTQTLWLGARTQKNPLDLWIYQEIIYELKPDFIIECGSFHGGSALFFASIQDLINKGNVISIDIQNIDDKPVHKRIKYLIGSSTSPSIIEMVHRLVKNKKTIMVVLDSDHSMQHVLAELRLYSTLVTRGSYLIVEDTNLNGHPIDPVFGFGPMEAVNKFLEKNNDFIIDKSKEKFLLTFHPNGFLLRVK